MGFGFEETMSGSWRDQGGGVHPIEFTAQVDVSSWRSFLATGHAALVGDVVAPPLTDGAALEGTIEIRPVLGRRIRYDFTFTADDGRPCRLVGQKDIRWRDALTSFTTLPAEILDSQGNLIGSCELHFDLGRDLQRLVGSVRWR